MPLGAAQVDTAIVEALVIDDDGHALPSVEIGLANSQSGFMTTALTATDGMARFVAIPPGIYDMSFTLQGRVVLTETGIALHVGQTFVLHATLRATFQQSVVVTGRPTLVDLRKTDSSTNIVPEQIEALPTADRDFQRLAFIAPSVQRERGDFRFVSGGPVIGAGANASQATVLIDGLDFTDPALGLATTRFSQDSIREFRVIADRFDSEVGGSAGGALSIVTRSGTNTASGRVFAFLRHDSLRTRGDLEQGKVPYSRNQVGAAAGGPLVRDRTHFFGSIEQITENNISLFRPGGAYQSQGSDIHVPFDQTLAFARFDHQMGKTSRLAGRGVYERFRQDNFRVGGVQDESFGQHLNRDNWSLNGEHSWFGTGEHGNQLRFQIGKREYDEPRNSTMPAEWFSNGNTLRTGGNILGDLLGVGTFYDVRDTYAVSRRSHQLRLGFDLQYVRDRSRIDVYQSGLLIYLTDTRAVPLAYAFGTGSADVQANTTRYAGFAQDDWSVNAGLKINLGIRYDVDTNGNDPDFRHPLVPSGRKVDLNNLQPRLGFSWDVTGTGRSVVRGGAGLFTGRYLLVPVFAELQQNGVTGRVAHTRLNGALIGLPELTLDSARPQTTGVPLPPDIGLIDRVLNAPSATQVSGGWTVAVGRSGLYVDAEGVYVKGRDEVVIRDKNFGGNLNPTRLISTYSQINTYTNEGHSEYAAFMLSVNGTLRGGHLLTASYTLAGKKNIADDFSPEFPFGYPDDPSNIEAEYGRSRSDERHRAVVTGVFKLPFALTVAAINEYGSGQPWTRRLGFDFNGDGKNSDRPRGGVRFGEDGPSFNQLSLRVTKMVRLKRTSVEAIGEAFNLFNATNFNVTSIDGAEFLSGPTLSNPALPLTRNATFGVYSATLPSREIQLGIRWTF